ncbi:MAG TPA: ATP-binding protein [Thermoanaerobaculia bacterium]|nr:ATP-binding protein [Thermoanaerobaculia bacterium]
MKRLLSVYAPSNRAPLLIGSILLIAAIAVVDWLTKPYISLGFLYLFPIMIMGGFLTRAQTVGVALICAVLQEAFSNLPPNEAVFRLVISSAGFVGTGFFVSELIRNRRIVLQHVEDLEEQARLRRDVEEQLRVLVESSPASIVTIDLEGRILLANEAAHQLLAPDGAPLEGQPITSYLPALHTAVQTRQRVFRTTLQCKGQRSNGEVFLAGLWFSTYTTMSGPRLAAIVVDLSDDLRSREDLSLDHLLTNSRILMSGVAHEVRNICSAVLVVHENLSRVPTMARNEDFQALGTLIQGLERMATLELRPPLVRPAATVALTSVLDELRVLIETDYRESGIEIRWDISDSLPPAFADRYGLLQVFLNLARNSQRAMATSTRKRLTIRGSAEEGSIVIRFQDTGIGIAAAEELFRPFNSSADSSGLGLYVSRAVLRVFGGDLIYEPRTPGCCFAVVLPSAEERAEAASV